ncbi:MFS transporter [Candidatus Thiomargarita nelsonii]|uniref:MFS transporter n=1 Tax=Candidatus Thiomargarita nelsonii TaxID=1003181 RepID=A0A0A6P338_9GAMM|nr:MFS transporter [Candidatus Thiomargarita nelsonii]
MRIFTVVWFGQTISLTGSELTFFALGVWVYQNTGSATQFGLIYLFTILPGTLLSPLAGALVDRWSRRWVMIISDTGAALTTLTIALLFITDTLEIWHIYLLSAISSAFSAFQWPAYLASMTLLVPKQYLGRANGMIQFSDAMAQLVAPVLGGVLLVTIQLGGVILLDLATFFIAMVTLLLVRFPEIKTTVVKKTNNLVSLLHEITYSWHYLKERPGLLGLLFFFTICYFFEGVVAVLVTPLILSFSTATVLGTILSIGGLGMLMGSLLMTTWGGPKRLIYAVFGFQLLGSLSILMAGLHTIIPLLALSAFLYYFTVPFTQGCSRAIWQRKTAPDVQGRVFSIVHMMTWIATPLAYLIAGPLADYVFEPLMATNGYLASSIGQIIGTGPGRGIGLLFIIMAIFSLLATIIAYQYPRLRLVDQELPDVVDDITTTPQSP